MMPGEMEQHGMVLIETFLDGSQEWECPVCGRHFIMSWPPNYKQVILAEGNPNAIHSGSTGLPGGMQLNMNSAHAETETSYEDLPGGWLPPGLPEEDPGRPYADDDSYLDVYYDWANRYLL